MPTDSSFSCLDKSVVPGQRLGSKNSHSSFFQKNGYVTVSDIKASLKWETERARHVLVCDFWNDPEKMGPKWEEVGGQEPHR